MNMDTTTEHRSQGAAILMGVAAALGAMVVAFGAWAVIGLYVARTLSLGLILLPLVSGCGSGFLLRLGGKGFGQRVGMIAVIVTITGCVIGDFAWLACVPNQKPVSELLGTGLVTTLNVVFNLQKAVMYAVAGYLSYAIASPAGTGTLD
jgi:hypothetical protein